MQSALSFAPLRPVGFVNFHGAGQGLLFAGRGGAACFSAGRGGATIPDCYVHFLGLPYLYYQLVLSWYLHQPESHQLSLQKVE